MADDIMKKVGVVTSMHANGPDRVVFTVVERKQNNEGVVMGEEQLGNFTVPLASAPAINDKIELGRPPSREVAHEAHE
jgi:hypothetical protein